MLALAVSVLAPALAVLVPQAAASASPSAPAPLTGVAAEIAAEVRRAADAYNAHDLAAYEALLDPEAVYIAEDGAVIGPRERVLRTFTRIFGTTPPRRIEVTDVTAHARGEAAWSTFKWTLTAGEETRRGVSSVLFVRADGRWKAVLIQNTASGHGAPRPVAASPSSGAAPASPRPSPSPSPH